MALETMLLPAPFESTAVHFPLFAESSGLARPSSGILLTASLSVFACKWSMATKMIQTLGANTIHLVHPGPCELLPGPPLWKAKKVH